MSRSTALPSKQTKTRAKARIVKEADPNQVLKTATELFVVRDTHAIRDINAFRALALNLLPQAEPAVRQTMACLLVHHPETPYEVLLALAADDDTFTAFPLLHHMEELPDEILITQARRGPDGLRKTIAERVFLSQAVVDVLLEVSGPGVIEALLLRDDLELSEDQVAALLRRPDANTGFGRMLRYKTRLSDSLLLGHYLYLTPEERNQAQAAAELLALADLGRSGRSKPVRPVFKPEILGQLRQSAMAPSPDFFASDLCYVLKLPRRFVDQMIQDDDGQTLTIALKALGFDITTACTILIRLFGERLSATALKALVQQFKTVSTGAAMALAGRWIAVEAPEEAEKRALTAAATAEETLQQLVSDATPPQSLAAPAPQTRLRTGTRYKLRPVQSASPYQETSRPAARRSGARDAVWSDIEEIESLLKFG